MATARKAWHRTADIIVKKPWDNDVLAAFTRLSAEMHDRWRTSGSRAAQASTIHLTRSQLEVITGKRRADVALTLARRLADVASMSVERDGDVTVIVWPNWPIFQGLHALEMSRDFPRNAPSAPAPSPAPSPGKTRIRKEGGAIRQSATRRVPALDPDLCAIIDAFNELGQRHLRHSPTQLTDAAKILKLAGSLEQALAVIRDRAGRMTSDDDRKFFRPSTLARARNWENATDEMASGITSGTIGKPALLEQRARGAHERGIERIKTLGENGNGAGGLLAILSPDAHDRR